jgi:hypothetical protein
MWQWMKRWIDWLRSDLFSFVRTRRSGFAVHISYEASGQIRSETPVPWLADAVVVEIVLRLPPTARRKSDYALQFPESPPMIAESVRPEGDERHRITFHFPVPDQPTVGELLWKHQPVAPIQLPVLTAEAFLNGLSFTNSTIGVRFGAQAVPARTCVVDGCKGFVASAMIRSATPLNPLADLGLTAEFRNERTGQVFTVPVPLTAAQRSAKETIVTALCPRIPRRPGIWSVLWRVGDRVHAADRIEIVAGRRFENTLQLLDTRFAVADESGSMKVIRGTPQPGAYSRVGPCFLVAGNEPGAVALCRLAVFAVLSGVPQAVQLLEEVVLATDAPTVFAPGLVEAADLTRIAAFELRLNGRVLGTVALSPVPPAVLTAEGGFKPPRDFAWTPAAEEDLLKRLGKLGP